MENLPPGAATSRVIRVGQVVDKLRFEDYGEFGEGKLHALNTAAHVAAREVL